MLRAGRLLFLENRAIVDVMVGVVEVRGGGVVVCSSQVVWRMINQEKRTDRQGRKSRNGRRKDVERLNTDNALEVRV